MDKLIFSNVPFSALEKHVDIKEIDCVNKVWTEIENIELTQIQKQQAQFTQTQLRNTPLHIMNEMTIWGRAIYPLLLLAENAPIRVLAGVPLKTQYKNFSLEGIVDSIFAKNISGYVNTSYFIIVETKRGIEAKNPIPQLYAELLAGAMLNQQREEKESQRIFGCYTIVDTWVFVQADIFKMDSKRPLLKIITSKEYDEKYEAITILKIIKNILQNTT